MPYFLDGNNLIGRARGRGAGEGDREALVREIADRLRRTRARATIFFDGPAGRETSLGSLALRCCGSSADDAIVRELERSRDASQIIVVTADRGLARRVRDAGASTLEPEAFWARFGAAPAAESRRDPQTVDVEEWIRYFADEANRD